MPEPRTSSELSIEKLDAAELLRLGIAEEEAASSAHSGEAGRFIPPTVELLADRFPEYEILEPLGFGGMGCVYKARQKHLDRIVALKILPAELSGDPAFAERFAREARMLARLTHPNIVTIHDFGQAGEFSFLVMEYVDGMNLREVLRTGGLETDQSLAVISALAGALDYAHAEGVVHRDIKPENILFDRRGHVKIVDFGLAKLAYPSAVNPTLTLTRQTLGTPHYMAPEQWEAPQEVDHRADIYALGVVGYEMLTGRLPMGKFDAPSALAKLPAAVDDVIHKALHRDPAKRYQEAREIQEALRPVISAAPQKAWTTPFGRDTEGQPLKRWEAMFREWASEYWPSQPVRNSFEWMRDEIVSSAKFAGRAFLKLPFGAIAGFALIIGMVSADWAVGDAEYTRTEYQSVREVDHDGRSHYRRAPVEVKSSIQTRGFDGFQTQTSFGILDVGANWIPLRIENYWVIVAAGGILFLALFRPVFGPKADLLAILLAVYGIHHVMMFLRTPPEHAVGTYDVSNLEYRAAPLIVGLTFFVMLLAVIWTLFSRVMTHFQETPKEDRHFLKSFYQSLLGLPPNR